MNERIAISAITVLVVFIGFTEGQVPKGHSLTVKVAQVTSKDAPIRIALFTSQDGFPDDFSKAAKVVIVKPDRPEHTFVGLAEGHYVVVVHHDLDRDGKVKKSLIGVPTEPIGLSNHPKLGFKNRPNYDKAKIKVNGAVNVTVNLITPG